MRQLIWKEWHEQRWKLGFGCIVLCAFALIGLRTRFVDDQSMMVATCALGVLLLPILAAAGLIAAEREEGTLRSLMSLPVAPWKVLAAKTIVGTSLCIGPLFASAAVSVLITRGREVADSGIVAIYARSTATTALLFVWMVCLSARSPNEGRAAALGIGVLVIWLLITSGLWMQEDKWYLNWQHPTPRNIPPSTQTCWTASPFVFVFAPPTVSVAAALCVELAIAALLWVRTVHIVATTATEKQQ